MKLLDRYKLSLHNIKNNKSRSILTTVIVYIISLLIMVILCIAISFSNNMQNVIKEYYETSDEPISVNYQLYGESENGKRTDRPRGRHHSPPLRPRRAPAPNPAAGGGGLPHLPQLRLPLGEKSAGKAGGGPTGKIVNFLFTIVLFPLLW